MRGCGNMAVWCGLACIALTGCTQPNAELPYIEPVKKSASVLFGDTHGPLAATDIGRSPWPATTGRYEGVEETVFVEFYSDQFGNEHQERTNPRRYFRSYRVGTQQR